MTESQACNKCEKRGVSAEIVLCNKTKKFICKDCCVKSSGGLAECANWKFCWQAFWL